MKYVTKDGAEQELESVADCIAAIGSGALNADSRVHDEGGWVRASEHPEIAALLRPSNQSPVETSGPGRLRIAARAAWIVGLLIPPVLTGAQGGSVAFGLGQAIGAAIFVGLIGAVGLLFVRNRAALGLVLGLLLCLLNLAMVGEQMATRARLHQSARKLQDTLASVPLSPSAASTSTARDTSLSTAGRPASSTDANLLDLTADMVNESKRLNEELLRQSKALDARTLISPDTLVSEARMRDGLSRMDAWVKYLDTYQQGVDRLAGDYETKGLALAVTDAQRSSFRSTFEASHAAANKVLKRFLDTEREGNVEVHALYAFMRDRIGLVRAVNNKLMFATSADVEAYASHIQRLKSVGERETQALADLRQMNQQGMTKLRDAAADAASR